MVVEASELIRKFVTTYLKQKGHIWRPTNTKGKENGNQESNEVCQILITISDELNEFLQRAGVHNEKFKDLTKIDLQNYENFKSMADGFFSPDIAWIHIVTFFVYGAERACRVAESSAHQNGDNLTEISNIIDWMCEYFDENLSQWVSEQDGGWMSIKNLLLSNQVDKSDRYKNLRHYMGVTAFAVFIGGLYLCSKISVD